MSSRTRQSSSDRRACARPAHCRDRTHPPSSLSPPRLSPPATASTGCAVRDPQIPIDRARPKQRPFCPRFPPWEAFGRRPIRERSRAISGRRPKPFTEGEVPGLRIGTLSSHSSFPPNLRRRLVLPEPDVNCVPQEVIGRPGQISDLGHKLSLDPSLSLTPETRCAKISRLGQS